MGFRDSILGRYRDNGKEHGNCFSTLGLNELRCATIIVAATVTTSATAITATAATGLEPQTLKL